MKRVTVETESKVTRRYTIALPSDVTEGDLFFATADKWEELGFAKADCDVHETEEEVVRGSMREAGR